MVEKVTAFQFSKRCKKEHHKLPKEIQKAFDEKLLPDLCLSLFFPKT